MQHLYSPWRSAYFGKKTNECVFCNIINNPQNDDENMVIFRDENCFGVMNLYPYSPGHFMIIPYKHTDKIENLDEKTWLKISLHVRSGVRMLKDIFNAQGVNIGMNLGSSAGAGIAEHVHYHIVPRWQKDTNFITTIANTRVNGYDFKHIYDKIKHASCEYFEKVDI